MPLHMPADVMLKLNRGGVHRLIVGHTPHGTCPTVIRSGGPGMHAPGITVVMADTSFSDMAAADNRGGAVAEVQVRSGDVVRVHGVLQDGTTHYDYIVQDDLLVGMQEPTGRMELSGSEVKMTETAGRRFVKAPLKHGEEYLMCHVSGFTTKYEMISKREAQQAVGMPASDVPQCTDRTPQKTKEEAPNELYAETGCLSAIIVSGLGDEGLIGLAEQFNEAKMKLLVELYKSIDKDGDGAVTIQELHYALVRRPAMAQLLLEGGNLPENSTPEELHMRLDGDGDGYATFEEMLSLFGLSPPVEQLKQLSKAKGGRCTAAAAAFAAIDADNNDKLDLEELLRALAVAGDGADRAEVEALFKRLDVNGDGTITMDEWQAGHSAAVAGGRL